MKKIKLSGGKYATVDDEDFPYLSRFRLIYTNGEAFATLHRENMRYVSIPLWAFIISAPPGGTRISFKNKNPLDYRKENLYPTKYAESNHRQKKRKTNMGVKCSSKYKGVNRRTGHVIKIWGANIGKEGKVYFLGYYKTEKEAALAYNEKARELYGEYAYQNKV